MIKVSDLNYFYQKGFPIIEDLSFEVQEGDFLGILGRNGAGKTTLIELLIGIKTPKKGSIKVLGIAPTSPDPSKSNEYVYLSHDISFNNDITIEELLQFHRLFFHRYSVDLEQELLEYFELDAKVLIGSLSTGQQKKVQIVAGLASDTKIIIIDEITAVLDPESRLSFFNKLVELNRKKKKTIILATNIYEDLLNRVNKVLLLNKHHGKMINNEQLNELYTRKK